MRTNVLFLFVFSLSLSTWAFKAPALTGPVMDEAGLLSRAAVTEIEQTLYAIKQKNGHQIQVFVTSSLQDEAIESVAIQIFDQWKLGDAKKDDGLLFLIAPAEKKLRIEVGQGLEGDIPDVIAKRIISDIVSPFFKRGEYDFGVVQGVAALQTYLNASPEQKAQLQERVNDSGSNLNKENKTKKYGFFFILGIWLLLFLFNPSMALSLLFFAFSRGGGGGRGGFGGGWSGGGGSSSGGGASGSW